MLVVLFPQVPYGEILINWHQMDQLIDLNM